MIIYIVRIDQNKEYYVQDLWVPNIITKNKKRCGAKNYDICNKDMERAQCFCLGFLPEMLAGVIPHFPTFVDS